MLRILAVLAVSGLLNACIVGGEPLGHDGGEASGGGSAGGSMLLGGGNGVIGGGSATGGATGSGGGAPAGGGTALTDGGAGSCAPGSSRSCAGGCTNQQQCVNGTWGPCTPACAAGLVCSNDACVCTTSSCAGCCAGNICQLSSLNACGTGGVACVSCDSAKADRCESGSCRCGANAACGGSQRCASGGSATASAVGFNDSQDRLVVPASAYPTSTASWTFASWIRLAVDRNQYSAFFTIEQPAGHSVEYNELVTLADGTTLVFFDQANGAAVTLGSLTVGTWYFAAISMGPGGAVTTYLAPAGGTLTKRTGRAAVISHIEMSYIGSSNFTFTEYLNGSMAMSRLWNGVLTENEINAEFVSATPARAAGLIGDWRLASGSTAIADSSGLGHHLTANFGATHMTVTGPVLAGKVCQ